MKNYLLLCLLLVLSYPHQAEAQVPIAVDLDIATFAYSEEESLLDIYLSFGAETLNYFPDSTGFKSDLPLAFSIIPSSVGQLDVETNEPIWTDAVNLSFAMADTAGIQQGQHFIHQVRTSVPPGEYELSVSIPEDIISGRRAIEIRRDVLVNDFSDSKIKVSDITLATLIGKSEDRNNPFYRNGLMIPPNPNLLYGEALPQIFYYTEVYNLTADDGDSKYTAYSSDLSIRKDWLVDRIYFISLS